MRQQPNPSPPPGPRPANLLPVEVQAGPGLAALLDPALDPLFAAPSTEGLDENWQLQLPFLGWLVLAACPAVLVQFGDRAGPFDDCWGAYATCCDVVARAALATRCTAIAITPPDGTGDGTASGTPAFPDALRQAHDRRHAAFSRLIAAPADEAAGRFNDGEIDLLVLDMASHPGRTAELITDRYAGWSAKLSSRAVVVLHGIAPAGTTDNNSGVAGLWRLLRELFPFFEFRQGAGLGVVACGATIPPALESLFALADGSTEAARLRERMTLLGERWRADHLLRAGTRSAEQQAAASRDALAEAHESLRVLTVARDRLRDELAFAKADRFRLERDAAQASARDRDASRGRQVEQERTDARADERTASALAEITARLERMRRADHEILSDMVDRADARRASERAAEQAAERAAAQLAENAAAENAAAAQALAVARAETAALRDALNRAEDAARAREQALLALQGSASWRVTRPLRTLRAALRRAPPPETVVLPAIATTDLFAVLPAKLATARTLPAPDPTQPIPPMPRAVPHPDRHALPDGVEPAVDAPESAFPLTASVAIAPADAATPDTALPVAGRHDVVRGVPDADTGNPATPDMAAAPAPSPAPAALRPGGWRPIRRVLFVAGEPGTPGAAYRTARNAAACRAAGYEAESVDIAGVNPDNLAAADLVVLWRAGFSAHVQTMLELAAHARTRVAFDVDDLIVQPSLAIAEIIDGIRTTFVTEAESRAYFQSMQRTMLNCDLCTTTTRELATAIGQQHPMVQVLPNAFDAEVARISRRAVRLRGEMAADGLVRLGYAGGTRTHQKDFALIAPSLASVLSQRAQARLVLFRDGASGEGLVLIHEFPELMPFADRIEWRDLVPLADLPFELARFDISLCPLEVGNPFCEAKSELKYFESALADVCLVATPTGPFRRAVQDGVTGFLPSDAQGWTETLLRLVDEPGLRRRVARASANDVAWRFGPRRQAELWGLLLAELDGGVAGARAADLALRRGDHPPAGLPDVPDGEVLFSHDRLGEAEVTVGMTSYNYEGYIEEALESVSAQTLDAIDLVVVDDGSRDGSVPLLLDWAERNRTRFNRLRILRTTSNAGLGGARNLVFDQAETPWVMVLDSDNRLAPEACETLLRAAVADGLAAFAYPRIRQFGGADTVMGTDDFQPARLAAGNYIDAMALVAKWAWAAAGGYYVRRDAMGWEDFSLWCRLVELGLHGVPVAEELAFYRVHGASMVNAITEQSDNKREMVRFVETRHRWLRLRMRAVRKRLDRPAAAG